MVGVSIVSMYLHSDAVAHLPGAIHGRVRVRRGGHFVPGRQRGQRKSKYVWLGLSDGVLAQVALEMYPYSGADLSVWGGRGFELGRWKWEDNRVKAVSETLELVRGVDIIQ